MKTWYPDREQCPHCGARGCCEPYGSYERNLVVYSSGKVICEKVTVQRVICRSCSTKKHKCTHAILPDVIVPYSSYSLLFILRVLYERFCLHKTIESLCEKYGISAPLYYRWVQLLELHMKEWIGVLAAAAPEAPAGLLRSFLEYSRYSEEFLTPFLHRTGQSFLQGHRNPANCRYPVFQHTPVSGCPITC